MKIFDVSLTISEDLPVWPGDKEIEIHQDLSIENGDVCNLANFAMSMHCGTHIDVPLHFIDKGINTENADLKKFIGKAKVFPIDTDGEINVTQLVDLEINRDDMVLFKVRKNCDLLKQSSFQKNFTSLGLEAAEYLIKKGIKAVGINYFSIEKFEAPGHPVHKALLGNEVAIVEGLNLANIEPGEYQLICLPLKLKNGNGSPVRAILIQE